LIKGLLVEDKERWSFASLDGLAFGRLLSTTSQGKVKREVLKEDNKTIQAKREKQERDTEKEGRKRNRAERTKRQEKDTSVLSVSSFFLHLLFLSFFFFRLSLFPPLWYCLLSRTSPISPLDD